MRTWIGLLALLAAGCNGQDPIATARQAVTGGEPHDGHPAVGRLRADGAPRCGATLVGPQTALTSAHCLAEGATLDILLDGGDTLAVSEAIPHPDYSGEGDYALWGGTRYNDVAVLRLAATTSVTPIPVSVEAARRGLPVVLVGYGSTRCTVVDAGAGVDATPTCDEAGTKRRAENTVHEVFRHEFSIVDEGNACQGDSGSPVLATVAQQEAVVGIPARGQMPCGELSYATRLDVFLPWVVEQSAGDVTVVGEAPDDAGGPATGDGRATIDDASSARDGGPSGIDGAVDPSGDLSGGCGLGRSDSDPVRGTTAPLWLPLLLGWLIRRFR